MTIIRDWFEDSNNFAQHHDQEEYLCGVFLTKNIHRIIEYISILNSKGIGAIAIMSNDVNDPKYGHEDSFDNMKLFSQNNNFIRS